MPQRHSYGWVKDKKDRRDFLYRDVHAPKTIVPIPQQVSLRSRFKEAPYDQGELGSCVANAVVGAFTYEHGGGPFSRLELYYFARALEGTTDQDSGCEIRDAIKALVNTGVGLEANWPYNIDNFAVPPSPTEMVEAAQNRASVYSSILTPNEMKLCLGQGYPFPFGINVFDSFESDSASTTGVIPVPDWFSESQLGGHGILCCGFSANHFGDGIDYWEFRNSWGTGWGDGGYGWLPDAYMLNSQNGASDCWTVRK